MPRVARSRAEKGAVRRYYAEATNRTRTQNRNSEVHGNAGQEELLWQASEGNAFALKRKRTPRHAAGGGY